MPGHEPKVVKPLGSYTSTWFLHQEVEQSSVTMRMLLLVGNVLLQDPRERMTQHSASFVLHSAHKTVKKKRGGSHLEPLKYVQIAGLFELAFRRFQKVLQQYFSMQMNM